MKHQNLTWQVYVAEKRNWCITSKLYPNLQFKAQLAYVKPNLNDYFNKTIAKKRVPNHPFFAVHGLLKLTIVLRV